MDIEYPEKYLSSIDNPFLKHAGKLYRDRAYRRERGEFVVEGYRVFDSVRGILAVLLKEGSSPPDGDLSGVSIFRVSGRAFDKITDSGSDQGLLTVCRLPPEGILGPVGRYLYLDGVQDPGNTGTLIRTAAAFGLDGVLLGPGCADPFSPKTVRSAAGAVFTIPLIPIGDPKALSGRHMIAADMKGTPVYETSIPKDFILAVGSEGNGLSGAVKGLCSASVSVPMRSGVDSLNAAVSGAIILYELCGKRTNAPCRPALEGRGP